MNANHDIVKIHVYAGTSQAGKVVHEELPAREVAPKQFELMASPALALNMAKGDIVEITSADRPAKVIKHGGNFCVQVYAGSLKKEQSATIERLFAKHFPGGSMDGMRSNNLAFSVPATADFDKINDFFDEMTDEFSCEWYFGNAYGEDGITPLAWWSKSKR